MTIALSHGGPTMYSTDAASREVLVGSATGIARLVRDDNGWRIASRMLTDKHIGPILIEPDSGLIFAGAYGVPPNKMEARIKARLVQMDLVKKHHTPAGKLSGGMRQLLALGCALVHAPPLVFLDEPTSGLDPVHRQQMWDLLYDLGDSGITIFVSTHYMDEAERCTDVGFIDNGRLLAKASPRKLMETFKAKLLELDVRPLMPALVRLREVPGVLGVSLRSGNLRVYAPEAEKLLAQWRARWPFEGLELREHRWAAPDMEDVFTAYSQGYEEMLNKAAMP